VADKPASTWRPIVRRRLTVLAGALVLWSMAIQAQLVNLQVLQHEEMSARAERQQQRTIESPAQRGDILDRHGRLLAYSVDADTVYAVPTEIEDPVTAASALCRALQDCSPRDRQMMADRISRGRHFAWVRRQVTPIRRVA
jgi:cell division protein FtsI (penicillin-binding protein 3)